MVKVDLCGNEFTRLETEVYMVSFALRQVKPSKNGLELSLDEMIRISQQSFVK
jgi:hypothetical protein